MRWAGGKRWLLKHLPTLLGNREFTRYHEPFLGGGSVFFHLLPDNAFLSDLNDDLIKTYAAVRDVNDQVIQCLKQWPVNEAEYYRIRSSEPQTEAERAARFIYLNHTSFNGIYRVNRKGQYNVPYGKKDNYVFDYKSIERAGTALANANLATCSFEVTLDEIHEGDLVFLDPPYTVAHNNNGFIEYNKKLFSLNDQYKLKRYIQAIDSLGAFYLLTNAAHPTIEQIFRGCGSIITLNRASNLGGKQAKRGPVSEFIITNIPQGDANELDG